MKPEIVFEPKFVKYIPDTLEPGIVYVSIEFATASHACACGCGFEVVTPISPTKWELIFDGVSVSLYPSIGNWSFTCKSHYWLRRNRVHWARRWSREEIAAGRSFDEEETTEYFELREKEEAKKVISQDSKKRDQSKKGIWQKFRARFFLL